MLIDWRHLPRCTGGLLVDRDRCTPSWACRKLRLARQGRRPKLTSWKGRPNRAPLSVMTRICLPELPRARKENQHQRGRAPALPKEIDPALAQRGIDVGRQHQGAALAGGEVLVGVEAEGDEISRRSADRSALPGGAERLRGVLDDAQLVPAGDGVEAVAVDRQAGEIDRDDGARRSA